MVRNYGLSLAVVNDDRLCAIGKLVRPSLQSAGFVR